jgi:hypothetical protein
MRVERKTMKRLIMESLLHSPTIVSERASEHNCLDLSDLLMKLQYCKVHQCQHHCVHNCQILVGTYLPVQTTEFALLHGRSND